MLNYDQRRSRRENGKNMGTGTIKGRYGDTTWFGIVNILNIIPKDRSVPYVIVTHRSIRGGSVRPSDEMLTLDL